MNWKLLAADLDNVLRFMLPIKARISYHEHIKRHGFTMGDLWTRSVRRAPNKTALIFADQQFSYAELDDRASKVARLLHDAGLECGARVAIYAHNAPSFWWHALAIIKAGGVPVVLRESLTERQMLNYLQGYATLPLLFVREGMRVHDGVRHRFEQIHAYDLHGDDLKDLTPVPEVELSRLRRGLTVHSEAFHIGTSSTTGVSKACIEHQGASLAFVLAHQHMKRITADDRVYTCATVSHGEGFMVGCFVQWAIGASVCLGDTFDPSTYFETCARHDVTVISYVGLMARKLLDRTPCPADTAHRIRVAGGHEMLGTQWRDFQTRFNISRIVEYFAATEGTFFFYTDKNPGTVGFAGPLTRRVYPFLILRIDRDNQLVLRHGRPVECEVGEVGELFGRIDERDPCSRSAYANQRLDQGSRFRSLMAEGDYWYRSGDLVSLDSEGRLAFAGKRKAAFEVDGIHVNPQVVEDKLTSSAVRERLGIQDAVGLFVGSDAGPRMFALRLHIDGPHNDIFERLADVLEPQEVPALIALDMGPFETTDTLRKVRTTPVIDAVSFHARYPTALRKSAQATPTAFEQMDGYAIA